MGANLSSDVENVGGVSRKKLDDVPENCIAMMLGHLDPLEICRFARLNHAFHGASSADFIWESKLPSNYPYLVQKILNKNNDDNDDHIHDEEFVAFATGFFTKKEIFAFLSRPNAFDGGNKEMWVDKSTGGVCMSISFKALSINGIDDRRYWNRIPSEESRFHTVAYLLQIWWLEVCGELDFKFPPGTYSLFFRLQLGKSSSKRFGRRVCNLEHIHGWDVKPVRFQLSTSDGQKSVSQCHLESPGSWMLYHGGDFVVKDQNKLTKIKFSMTQIDCTHTKGGLSLDSVLIHPKSVSSQLKDFCRHVL